jgi:hypothetical protein
MRTLVNDLNHIVLSCGNAARRLPISIHSFEQQLTKVTSVTIEEIVAKSEAATLLFLNLTIGDDLFTDLSDGLIYTVD